MRPFFPPYLIIYLSFVQIRFTLVWWMNWNLSLLTQAPVPIKWHGSKWSSSGLVTIVDRVVLGRVFSPVGPCMAPKDGLPQPLHIDSWIAIVRGPSCKNVWSPKCYVNLWRRPSSHAREGAHCSLENSGMLHWWPRSMTVTNFQINSLGKE